MEAQRFELKVLQGEDLYKVLTLKNQSGQGVIQSGDSFTFTVGEINGKANPLISIIPAIDVPTSSITIKVLAATIKAKLSLGT
ncbi:MAG: hypothetical protein EBX40_07725, partial [Gammaproteobacteria bacterium]|nr:hypothetical protein [Gammaproteobacteria bacterium]